MPSVPESHARGSKILLSNSAPAGSCCSALCILRVMVCDISSADDQSLDNASFACARPGVSNMSVGNAPKGVQLPVAFIIPAKKFCVAAGNSFPPRPHSSAIAFIESSGVTSEHHHLSDRFAFVQAIESEIDLFK